MKPLGLTFHELAYVGAIIGFTVALLVVFSLEVPWGVYVP